ncbi:MAG: 4-(cytidine 5'-diphospho)-2-C-methyl-D-erythritol kinase [Candidatus Omnitrophota bacterium]
MKLRAPAKINLFLKVIREMEDGYHQIDTLFERVSLFDYIYIDTSANARKILCDSPDVPTGEDSLIGRTVRAFEESINRKLTFEIKIEKNIPVGAGLGGGSSDAAAVLTGLSGIMGDILSEEELFRIGGGLGADIPFFLSGASFGYGSGRGDIIEKLEKKYDLWHVLVNPPFQISTKDVYSKVSPFTLTNNIAIDKMFTVFSDTGKRENIAGNLYNDLEAIVLQDFPVLKQVFSEIREAGAEGVLLSGSGPTVFGVFRSRSEAESAEKKLVRAFPEEQGWRVFTVNTC